MGDGIENKNKTVKHKISLGKLEMFLVWVKNWKTTFALQLLDEDNTVLSNIVANCLYSLLH